MGALHFLLRIYEPKRYVLNMEYEKPQKGNPYSLTINQHSFPAASITRFVGTDNCVELYLIKQKKEIRVKADDHLFCAKRIWDQCAESGFMKKIEDTYQELAESVISGTTKTISNIEKSIVTNMFALWNIRTHRKENPIEDQKIEGIIDVASRYSKDEQEKLEKNHIGAIKPDHTISGRHLNSGNIQLNLFKVQKQMSDAQWGILRASKGQFIVPDNFSNARILPVSPIICFFSQSTDEVISETEVREINKLAIVSSRNYYFANDLSKCPR